MKSINSKNSDYGATWTSNNYNEVIFTSTREGVMGKEKDAITGERFCDLFVVRQDKTVNGTSPSLHQTTTSSTPSAAMVPPS